LAAPLAGQAEGLESLTEKFSQAQRFTIIEKVSTEKIASAIGSPEAEMVFKLLEHPQLTSTIQSRKFPLTHHFVQGVSMPPK